MKKRDNAVSESVPGTDLGQASAIGSGPRNRSVYRVNVP